MIVLDGFSHAALVKGRLVYEQIASFAQLDEHLIGPAIARVNQLERRRRRRHVRITTQLKYETHRSVNVLHAARPQRSDTTLGEMFAHHIVHCSTRFLLNEQVRESESACAVDEAAEKIVNATQVVIERAWIDKETLVALEREAGRVQRILSCLQEAHETA